jgi:hypothetical protein
MNSRSHRPVVATLVASTTAACTGLLGFDGLRPAPPDSGGSCAHRAPPGRPNVAGRGGSLDLVFARSTEDLGYGYDAAGRPRYLTLGYDLDSTCTGEGEGSSCVEPAWASANHTDGIDGTDNAIGPGLFHALGARTIPVPAAGTGHDVLFRIRGYSGEADDDAVDFSVYVGLDVAPREAPLWDGSDRWTIHPDVLVPSGDGTYSTDQPSFHDDQAYVSGWVMVAHLPEVLWGTGTDLAPDHLDRFRQLVLTARLVQVQEQKWELREGMWGARMPFHDALLSKGLETSFSSSNKVICQFKSEYEMWKSQVCSYVDIASGPDSPSSPCDALSMAAGFEAKQALLGEAGRPPGALPSCAPGVLFECP